MNNFFKSCSRFSTPWSMEYGAVSILNRIVNEMGAVAEVATEVEAESGGVLVDQDGQNLMHISLNGTMMQAPTAFETAMLGATDTNYLIEQLEYAKADNSIKGVLLDIDSGGGSIGGVIEASDLVAEIKSVKPVVAYTGGTMASAAYWVGSQASMLVANKSARVGSVGVYLPVVDNSKAYESEGIEVSLITNDEGVYKGAGYEGVPLSSEQKDMLQAEVNEIYGLFKGAIKETRSIEDSSLRGQAFMGSTAKEKGFVDLVDNKQGAMELLRAEIKRRNG